MVPTVARQGLFRRIRFKRLAKLHCIREASLIISEAVWSFFCKPRRLLGGADMLIDFGRSEFPLVPRVQAIQHGWPLQQKNPRVTKRSGLDLTLLRTGAITDLTPPAEGNLFLAMELHEQC